MDNWIAALRAEVERDVDSGIMGSFDNLSISAYRRYVGDEEVLLNLGLDAHAYMLLLICEAEENPLVGELREAAEKCFNAPLFDAWWGFPKITEHRAYDFCMDINQDMEDFADDATHGDWSVYFLLLCAEAAKDVK